MTNTAQITERELRLVKKSMALSKGTSNEHEAMSVMLKAQEVLAKYNLEISDLTFENDENAAPNKEVSEADATEWHKIQKWEKDLARVIADNFRCEAFWRTTTVNRCGLSKMYFLGLKEDAETAVFVYNYAIDVMKYLAKKYCTDNFIYGAAAIKQAKLSYLGGFVKGLSDKFATQVQSMALVLVKDALVEQKKAEMGFRTDTYGTRRKTQDIQDARSMGYKEGKRFDHTETNKLKG